MNQQPIGKLIFLFLLVLTTGCSKPTLNCDCSKELPQNLISLQINTSMKGWELYSWPQKEQGCNNWNYAILPSTNRLKSYNEVTSDTVLLKVIGNEQLKLLLNKFPKNENIFWMGEKWLSQSWGLSNISYQNLKLPSSRATEAIKQHALMLQLNLTIDE